MFIKAKIDPMFDSVRPQVDALLEDILQKTKVKAEKEISDAEFALHGMKKWFDGGYASSDDVKKYKHVRNKISDVKRKFATQSYFGYDDAIGIISEANAVVHEIKESITGDLHATANRLSARGTEDSAIPDKLRAEDAEKWSAFVKSLLGLIGVIVLFKINWYIAFGPGEGWTQVLCFAEKSFGPIGLIIVALIGGLIGLIVMTAILIGGIPAAIYMLILLIRSIAKLLSTGGTTKHLKARQRELEEEIATLEHRVAIAEESLSR